MCQETPGDNGGALVIDIRFQHVEEEVTRRIHHPVLKVHIEFTGLGIGVLHLVMGHMLGGGHLHRNAVAETHAGVSWSGFQGFLDIRIIVQGRFFQEGQKQHVPEVPAAGAVQMRLGEAYQSAVGDIEARAVFPGGVAGVRTGLCQTEGDAGAGEGVPIVGGADEGICIFAHILAAGGKHKRRYQAGCNS